MNSQRILIYGVTGSGKTTLARRLGEALGYEWISADDAFGWLPGWTPRDPAEQRELVAQAVAKEQWVLDTAYGQWIDLVLPRAELIVALDYARIRSLSQLVRRTLRRVIDKKPICNGNTETWSQLFSSDSIIVWHFRSFSRKRARIRGWAAESPGPLVVRLRTPRQTARFLAGLDLQGTGTPGPSGG